MVDIVCDGNGQIGFGHIRRSMTLAQQLTSDGVDVNLVALSETSKGHLGPTRKVDGKAAIRIFDTPYLTDGELLSTQASGQIAVTLDWFGHAIPDINIVIYPHNEVKALKQSFVGFDYIMIRSDVLALRSLKRVDHTEEVLIVLGGSDLLGQGHSAANRLALDAFKVTLVQGPLSKNRSTAANYDVAVNPDNLAELMRSCSWAVTNGGSCLFEAMCLGKATLVLPQTYAEQRIADFVQAKDAILGIGMEICDTFTAAQINAVGERAYNTVDGLGASRLSLIVRGLV